MGDKPPDSRQRRRYEWPREAEHIVRQKVHSTNIIQQLRHLTGFPEEACWRFAEKRGVRRSTRYRRWLTTEQQKLLEMSESRSVKDIAAHFHCSESAVYHVIHRNQRRVGRGSEWFGLNTAARHLRVKIARLEQWVAAGKLNCVSEMHGGRNYRLISGAELCRFCKANRHELIGQRIAEKRMQFLIDYVFAAEVQDDYTARSSKREREAFARGEYRTKESFPPSAGDRDEKEDSFDSSYQ